MRPRSTTGTAGLADPRRQLEALVAKHPPAVVAIARAVLDGLERRLPSAVVLVYDKAKSLVIGFGPNERASDCPLSIALYSRWVNLYFLEGAQLPDPEGLLKGTGTRVRHVTLSHANDFADPRLQKLLTQAITLADPPMPPKATRRTIVIKSVAPLPSTGRVKRRPDRILPRQTR